MIGVHMFIDDLIVTLRYVRVSRAALVVSVMLASFQLPARGQGKDLETTPEIASAPSDTKPQTSTIKHPVEHPTFYRTTQIDGLSIFYREAGPKDAPTLLLLHGLPSSPHDERVQRAL
jgi:hypothetical protein